MNSLDAWKCGMSILVLYLCYYKSKNSDNKLYPHHTRIYYPIAGNLWFKTFLSAFFTFVEVNEERPCYIK